MKIPKHFSLFVSVYVLGFLSSLEFGSGSNESCIEIEKQALLFLKNSLVDDSNYLWSWVGDDCCAWKGIYCDIKTRNVIRLDLQNGTLRGGKFLPSLLNLKYLKYLDLSCNNFDVIHIPEFFGSFKYLEYLNLSYSSFEGLVPHHFGNLSSLRYLDINNNDRLSIDSMSWLSKLSLLEHLDLSYVDLSRATDWFPAINMLPSSLLVLKLYNCQLPSNIPPHLPLVNLTSLISLNLGGNKLNSSFPQWIFNNSGLAHLTLMANYFYGPIPSFIGSLTSLSELDLSFNNFHGLIPKSIGNLTSLSRLALSFNDFYGLIPKSIANLASLTELDLQYNKLDDSIAPEIGNLTELQLLFMRANKLKGCLPETFCKMSKLILLDVRYNQLSGMVPKCIGELSNLEFLLLYSNLWEGFVSEDHFVNLTRLAYLEISSKSNLVLNVSSKWVPPFQLQSIRMESLKVGPKFPRWLLTQRQISTVEMVNSSISDTIPTDWFASLLSQASHVDLSNNDIIGEQLSLISVAPNGVMYTLALSDNQFSGEFPAFICNLTYLTTLVLSNNNFSGDLPHCLGNLTVLRDLDVMNNSLSGNIPASLGSLADLFFLHFYNNKFQGKIPLSFQNLTALNTLDLGKNNLSDIIPPWIGEKLPHLQLLTLQSNNFHGKIPTQLCHHTSIQVLNLARNQITGDIPPCFGNFSAMITSDNSHREYFSDSELDAGVELIDDTKGYELKYTTTLEFLISIDLSNNSITGEIPEELMDLYGLLNLNLAGNRLTGRIPNIGKLKKLEFLDLSRNKLYGPIPQSLSKLNFLSHLNLSFNNLSGKIPTGNQLQTLDDPSIYVGNNQLCGQPRLKPCTNDKKSKEADSDLDDEHTWFYAGIGPGLLVGFLGFCATLHFIPTWRQSFFYHVERFLDRIAVSTALLWRKFHN